MIYVIGIDSDRTFRYFLTEVTRRGIEVEAINLRAIIADGNWHFSLPDDGNSWIEIAKKRYQLDSNAAYYCRIIDLSTVQSDVAMALRWRSLLEALSAWLEHIPGTVINRPGTGSDNFSKPLHEYVLTNCGFNIPPSLTSSDAQRLSEFASIAPAIVKPVSGIRADSRLVKPAEFDNFHSAQGPVHLQRYIKGADVRAHVVGNQVHAELIRCSQVDYRRSHQEAEYIAWELPESLSKKIIDATAAFGLIFAGWDFKVAEDNEYWCLEANPMPGYDGYDRRLGGCITDSLIRFLEKEEIVNQPPLYPSINSVVKQFNNIEKELFTAELLSHSECQSIYDTLHQLQKIWICRDKSANSFFTLGAASYLEFDNLVDGKDNYDSIAKKYNPILEKHFGWLYERVRIFLEQYLGTVVNYESNLALPGFHVWLSSGIFTQPTASIHFDLQHKFHDWKHLDKIDFTKVISFTLPIKLPKYGGGLNVWNTSHQEYIDVYNQGLVNDIEDLQNLSQKTLVPYQVGNIVIHSGNSLHQIAPVSQVDIADERITFQGHGVFCDEEWKLYW